MPFSQSKFLGMDMDTSYSLRDGNKYFKLHNGQLVVDEAMGVGTISNVNGNEISFKLPQEFDDLGGKGFTLSERTIGEIVGATSIENYVVLFVASENAVATQDELPDYVNRTVGSIWAFKYNSDDSIVDATLGRYLTDTAHLIFYDRLNFVKSRPVVAIGNSESPDIKKVYFDDGLNILKFINILEQQWDVPMNQIEMLSDVDFVHVNAKATSGGSFFVGAVQYAYQQFNYNGAETKFSVCSPLINISKADYSAGDTLEFLGSDNIENDTPTDKAVEVTIDYADDRFEYTRLIRIFYKTSYGTPEITVVSEQPTGDNIIFIDDGMVTLGTISYQELETIGTLLFSAKDLAVANQRLIAANINEDVYNPDYDARAYRHKDGTDHAKVYKANDPTTFYSILDSGAWSFYDGGVYSGGGLDFDIPEDFDCIQPDQSLLTGMAFTTDTSLKLGGTGKNVSYTFDIIDSTKTPQGFILDDTPMAEDKGDVGISISGTVDVTVPTAGDFDVSVDPDTIKYGVSNGASQDWNTEFGSEFLSNDSFPNYTSTINVSQLVGYQRGEVYRFGIVFFDEKGRKSPVKWIGDIKFPDHGEDDEFGAKSLWYMEEPSSSSPTIGAAKGCPIYINFQITNIPESSSGFQIVRVKRLDKDMTILSTGYVTPTFQWGFPNSVTSTDYEYYRPTGSMMRYGLYFWLDGGDAKYHYAPAQSSSLMYGELVDYYYAGTGGSGGGTDHIKTKYHPTMFNFWSPEISFNRTLTLNNTQLVVFGKATRTYSSEVNQYNPADPTDVPHPYLTWYKSRYIQPISNVVDPIDITDSLLFTTDTVDEEFGFAGEAYKHYNVWYYDNMNGHTRAIESSPGSCALIELDTPLKDSLWPADYADPYTIIHAYIKRDLAVQYGGNTYEARKANEYIGASKFIAKYTNPLPGDIYDVNTFGGDVYMAMFEQARVYHSRYEQSCDRASGSDAISKYVQNFVTYPTESTINIDWRSDALYTKNKSVFRGAFNEEKGVHSVINGYTTQEQDAYTLNWVYQRYNDINKYFEESLFFDELIYKLEHRMDASDSKYDGEASDSWLKFKVNNIQDVDGTKGPINAIEAFSDNVYFFQSEGIGVTRIDERALVNDTQGISLVLGTGDVFSKYQYITENSGVDDVRAVTKGRQGVYFYDWINKTISVISGKGVVDLGRAKGMKSYIKNSVDKVIDKDTTPRGGCIMAFDETNGMVYSSFINETKDSFTLGYSEETQSFTSFFDFIPGLMWSNESRFISTPLTIPAEFSNETGWLHNIGEKGNFYGTIYDTIVTLMAADNPSYTKVFDAIEYTHDADEVAGSPPNDTDTFYQIRAYNNFLDTGVVAFNPDFRFRTWRAKLPRYTENGKNNRLLGKYLKIELHFDNMVNTVEKDLFLQPVLTFWRPVSFVEH